MANIRGQMKNPWQAPPSTHFDTVFIKKTKILEDIEPGTLRVEFKTSP